MTRHRARRKFEAEIHGMTVEEPMPDWWDTPERRIAYLDSLVRRTAGG